MITLKQINNQRVNPIQLPLHDVHKIRGHELFEEPYANIFLLAKKKSGKTNTIFKILKASTGRNTKIIIFSSTVSKDPNWIHIQKFFKNKKTSIQQFTSIKEDRVNHIQEILKNFQDEIVDSKEEKPKLELFSFEELTDNPKKENKLAPEYIFVFDDIGNELQDKFVSQLLKTNRHYKSKVIISSQYLNDLTPQSRKQIDYMLLFKGQPVDKLKTIHEDLDLATEFNVFLTLYNNATLEKFCFLYIDCRNEKYRNCFDKEYSEL